MLINPYMFGRLWTPADITTALWLDAADSSSMTLISNAVSQWNDKSGNSRHASQSTSGSRPTFSATAANSLPGIVFNGSSSFLQSSLGNYSLITRSVYFVISFSASVGNQGILSILPSGATANDFSSTDGVCYASLNTGLGFRCIGSTSGNYDIGNATTGAAIYGEIKSAGNGQLYRFDGTPGSDTVFTEFSAQSGRGGYVIGRRWLNGALGNPFTNGVIQEIVYCPDTHSTNTRNRMFGYLAWKWGLSANLPAGHPYKSAAPTV